MKSYCVRRVRPVVVVWGHKRARRFAACRLPFFSGPRFKALYWFRRLFRQRFTRV